MSVEDARVEAPAKLWTWTEFPRAMLEFATFATVSPLMSGAAKGDGHDVLFLPGFLWSDRSTRIMRRQIAGLGYRTHGWELGNNRGPTTIGATGERLAERVQAILCNGGGRLSLVGHSLGGIMARNFALQNPELVRQVVCVGSPFVRDFRGVNSTVVRLHDWLTGVSSAAETLTRPEPLQVPVTAIFSILDGLVAPPVCTELTAERAENIGVYGSHVGMMVNPAVYYALADRLSQPAGEWEPFHPQGWRRAFYTDLAAETSSPPAPDRR